ncbi:MAG: ATP-grasp domain-containing protein [Mongoliitalea sp.]
MKKVLVLGGAPSQVPFIKYCKNKGYYVITADYLPNNPGHLYSDRYYNVSTVNTEDILKIAAKNKIDGVFAYASDPAAITAAYVSEKLGLNGGGFEAVKVLSNKALFREFQQKNRFSFPKFYSFRDYVETEEYLNENKEYVIKPVDSSGSKGVFKIKGFKELKNLFEVSKSFSRSGEVIIEELIPRKGPQIHGEGFVVDGDLKFILLGDQYFSGIGGAIPYSTLVPSVFHKDVISTVVAEVSRLIKSVGFQNGGINIEVIISSNDEIFILEIGARNGGNFMPSLIKYSSGFDLIAANVGLILNESYLINSLKYDRNFKSRAQLIVHSLKYGVLNNIDFPEDLKHRILECNFYNQIGDSINEYNNSKDVIGVCIIDIENYYLKYLEYLKLNQWIKVN